MTRLPYIMIDGKRYRWRDLLQLRREQCAAAQAPQLALLTDLPDDSRPRHERTASRRYQPPSLLTRLEEAG